MKERTVYQKVRNIIKHSAILTRIESGSTGVGIPDLFIQVPDGPISLWCELKSCRLLKRTLTVKPEWRPGQIAWAKTHQKAGGLWILICSVEKDIRYSVVPKDIYENGELKPFYGFDQALKMRLKNL